MELLLKRVARKPTYTIGHLYIDGKYFCDTVEDKDRDLNRNGKFDNGEKKVYAETAIPNGRYRVTMNVQSPKFSLKPEYNWWKVNGKVGFLPRLLNVSSFDGILIHCLTPDTEILTAHGWQDLQSFKNNPAQACFSFNAHTNEIELTPITDFIERDYQGLLYKCEGKRVNYSVTDKHRMYVGSKTRKGTRWEFRTADNLLCQMKFRTSAFKIKGDDITETQMWFYRLLMATQADGYLLNWSVTSGQVRFHFVKERKIDRIKKIVTKCGGSFKEFVDSEGKTHISVDPQTSNLIIEALNPFRIMRGEKNLPIEILNLKAAVLRELILEYLFWDGRYENYLKDSKNMIISSTNYSTISMLQAMAVMCGMRTNCRLEKPKNGGKSNLWDLKLYSNQEEVTPHEDNFTTEPYDGKVWCLSNQNTTLIIRKNGRTMVIGNCGSSAKSSAGCIIVGKNTIVGKVTDSMNTCKKLYPLLQAANSRGEQIWITVK